MSKTLLLFFLVMPTFLLAQKHIYVRAVAGNYWMSDMKDMQKDIQASLGHASSDVRSFPVSVQAEIGFDFSVFDRLLRTIRLGGYVNYTQAKGRINYSNSGGVMNFDQNFKRITVGARGLYNLREHSSVYCKVGLGVIGVALETSGRTNSSQFHERSTFSTGGLVLEPGYEWRKTRNRIQYSFNAGYELNVNGKVWADDYHFMVDGEEKPVKVDLGGFRIGAGVAFKL
jgi:hypothetical protein